MEVKRICVSTRMSVIKSRHRGRLGKERRTNANVIDTVAVQTLLASFRSRIKISIFFEAIITMLIWFTFSKNS